MITHTIKKNCSGCGKTFFERVVKLPKKNRTKRCPQCKNQYSSFKKVYATPAGGNKERGCHNCLFFQNAKTGWGECQKGVKGRMTNSEGTYEDIDLVYEEDICNQWRSKDDTNTDSVCSPDRNDSD